MSIVRFPVPKARTAYYGILLCCMTVWLGCAQGGSFLSRAHSANVLFGNGQYERALAKYQFLIEKAKPMGKAHEISTARLGMCYYELDMILDAEHALKYYLDLYPSGEFKYEVKEYLSNIMKREEEEALAERQQRLELKEKALTLTEALNANSEDAPKQFELANIYWQLDEYEKAQERYLNAIEIDETYLPKIIELKRLFYTLNGDLMILTPERRIELEKEENPIKIFNTSETPVREMWSKEQRDLMVTGQVENVSRRTTVIGLIVRVTLFDLEGDVIHTQETRMGTLVPRQIRSFALKFPGIDALENVQRIEYQTDYTRKQTE